MLIWVYVKPGAGKGEWDAGERPCGTVRRLPWPTTEAIRLYGTNLVLNAAWTWLFFRFRLLRAALLLVPYALWVAFAAALNWAIAARNRG